MSRIVRAWWPLGLLVILVVVAYLVVAYYGLWFMAPHSSPLRGS